MDNGIIKQLQKNGIPYEENVDLKKKTWIHRGGTARLFVQPSCVQELQDCVEYLYAINQSFLLVGHTSNLYIHNECNLDVVISTTHCNAFTFKDGIVECDCGAAVSKVAKASIDAGLQGMEYLTTLPGTVGAAVCNNSTVKESRVADLLVDLDFIDEKGHLTVLNPSDLDFSFRSSAIKKGTINGVILRVRLCLKDGNAEKLRVVASQNEERRKRILEGPIQNLGCTVNRTFSKGKMPKKYRIRLDIYTKLISFFVPVDKRKNKIKNYILRIAGYKELAPYISDKQMITFIWRDEKADDCFPRYLEFMSRVYQTDSLEIQEIKNN